MKSKDGPYDRAARDAAECIRLEGLKTNDPETLARIFVMVHSWGQGDALAGLFLNRMLTNPSAQEVFAKMHKEHVGVKHAGGRITPMTLLFILEALAKTSITFRYISKGGDMRKAKAEITAKKKKEDGKLFPE